MKAAQVRLTAEHMLSLDPIASAVSEVAAGVVRIEDHGSHVSYKLRSGHWVTADMPAEARDLDAFYAGRDTAAPVVFTIEVPDEDETGLEAAA